MAHDDTSGDRGHKISSEGNGPEAAQDDFPIAGIGAPAGGMSIVQSPSTDEYDRMPRNATATGLADFELLPAEMAAGAAPMIIANQSGELRYTWFHGRRRSTWTQEATSKETAENGDER